MNNNTMEETKRLNAQSVANKGKGRSMSNNSMTSSTIPSNSFTNTIEETKRLNADSVANKGKASR